MKEGEEVGVIPTWDATVYGTFWWDWWVGHIRGRHFGVQAALARGWFVPGRCRSGRNSTVERSRAENRMDANGQGIGPVLGQTASFFGAGAADFWSNSVTHDHF